MAGHASNWFKVGKGSAKGKVFISNATLLGQYGAAYDGPDKIKQIKKDVASTLVAPDNPAWQEADAMWNQEIVSLSQQSPQPGGVAKSGPSPQQEKANEANAALTGTDYTMGWDSKSKVYTFWDGKAGKSSTLPEGVDPVQFATVLAGLTASQGEPLPEPTPKPKKAKAAPAPTPGNGAAGVPEPTSTWATDPGSVSVIEAQKGGVYSYGSGTEAQYIQAYQAANPDFAMTWEEQSALSDYQASGYQALNKSLWKLNRAKNGKMSVASTTKAARLMELSKKLSSPFDFTSTRAVRTGHALHAWAQSVGVGDMYVNKGFDSSSLNPDISPIDGTGQLGTRVRFRVPKGAKGIYMNGVPGYPSSHKSEVEWLVPANSSWLVSSRTVGADGVIEVVVDLVDQRDFSGATIWP